MPVQNNTPLSYLMDMLYIQGTQLAKMVHVDRTVISRWKNGRTELSMKSAYFDDIVNAVLDINELHGLGTLERFFTSITKKTVSKRKDLHKLVSSWLVSKEFERQFHEADTGGSLYNATYKIYRGASGKHDAASYMLEVLESSEEKDTLLCYDTSPDTYSYEENEHSILPRRIFNTFAELSRFCVIFFINRPADQIFQTYKRWLPLFLMKHSTIHYTYDTEPPFYNYVYGIKGRLAIVGASHEHDRQNQYTAAYSDPITVSQIDASLENMASTLPQLFRKFETRDICLDMQDAEMSSMMDKNGGQYIIHQGLPLLNFSGEVVEQVIADLNLEFAEERRLQTFAQNCAVQIRRIIAGNDFNRLIIGQERLLRLLEEEKTLVPSLSALLEREVWLDSRYILNAMLDMLDDVANNQNVELALSPPGFDKFLEPADLWVKNHCFAYISGSNDTSSRLMSSEFVTVNAFFMAAEKYWARLPYECMQKKWINEQLKSLR